MQIYNDIYDNLYEIVVENLQAAGNTFEYGKETFLCNLGSYPQVMDVSKYLSLPNPQFFQAAFVSIYRRMPKENESAVWEEKYNWPREKFQVAFLKKLEKSNVTAIYHIRFINNPYFEQHRGIRYRMLGILYVFIDEFFLREFVRKLPQLIQKILRRVFL